MKPILIGVLSSVFFAVTFILNRSMELAGGSWLWSSSLRYFFMVPFLFIILYMRGTLFSLLKEVMKNWQLWMFWSTVGFGLFYAPLTYAASSGPGWLVAGTWQFTIIAGVLLTPLFREKDGNRKKVPLKNLLFSCLIFIGIIIIQLENASSAFSLEVFLKGMLPVIIAAFAYPIGNRKMMEHYSNKIDTFQRVCGMTIASMPLWITLAIIGYVEAGPPSADQVVQSLMVAVSSGVIATVLFFFATELAKDNSSQLAAVEATQSTQVLFVMFGEILFLSEVLPSLVTWGGIMCIIVGMLLHSLAKTPTTVIKKGVSVN
ncbi:multidrug resistance efflux transporter family protein [Cytobacillus sp. FJAT-54145]|uniref:Multidrug resistance efflux transporter family protein n=1 Tax=Cytobacillus spartinae TaxID=3299023 RepID=A0ABW6KHV2_9BACI